MLGSRLHLLVAYLAAAALSACVIDGHYILTEPDAKPDGAGPTDAPPSDAPAGQVRFDVGYVEDWDLGTEAVQMQVGGWIRIVNTGAVPIDLSTMSFVSVSDNHPQLVVSMINENTAAILQPGFAFGNLNGDAQNLLVFSGKMTEPLALDSISTATVGASQLPAAGTWLFVNGVGVLQIGNATANIPITIRSSGVGNAATAVSAERVSSVPL